MFVKIEIIENPNESGLTQSVKGSETLISIEQIKSKFDLEKMAEILNVIVPLLKT